MSGIELQIVANGRQVSLDEVAELIAGRVAQRVVELKDRLVQPTQHVERNSERKVVSVQEAAKLLGLSRSTIWHYIKNRRIDTVRLGPHTTRIRMDAINAMVRDGIPEPKGGRRSSSSG